MADIDTFLNLEALHTQIRDQIAAAFPDFHTVEFYRDDEDEKFPTPAILLELNEVEPDQTNDAGTGQLPVLLRFEARIVMGIRTPQVRMAVRLAATALATWLHDRHWGNGINADACMVTACMRDEFDPAMDKWSVWRVEWHNQVFMGVSAWNNDGTVPESWFSFSPDIGTPNVDKYEPAVPV